MLLRYVAPTLFLLAALRVSGADSGAPIAAATTRCACSCVSQGSWTIAESENFSFWSKQSQRETVELVNTCEQLRQRIAGKWFDEPVEPTWRPKCVVVLHPDQADYSRAIGSPAEQSVGCTTLTRDKGRILFRRIDLRSDAVGWTQNALPHELTHVIFADAFPDRPLPNWLNEGLAMTSEGRELKSGRLKVLDAADWSDELSFRRLLDGAASTRSVHVDVQYAFSLSLVNFLLTQGDEVQLLEFARLATMERDYSAALEKVYRVHGGVAELEQQWRAFLRDEYVAGFSQPRRIEWEEVRLVD